MGQQAINLGAAAGDGTGDTLRAAGGKLNAMTAELYRSTPAVGAQRSIGERLRRARERAMLTNPLVTAPFIIPPAWAQSVDKSRGELVTNTGNVYVCVGGTAANVIKGTTSATGAGPTGTATIVQTDGTVSWAYYGQLHALANDVLAPTVSSFTTPLTNAAITALPNITYVTPTGFLKYQGVLPGAAGFGAPTGGSNKTYPPAAYFKALNSTTAVCNGGVLPFMSSSAKIGIILGAANTGAFNARVMVDCFDGKGWRYIQASPFIIPAGLGDPQFGIVIDWSSVGGRKPRSYRVETAANTGVNSIRTLASDDPLWLPPANDDLKAYYLSDSWGEGTAGSVLGSGHQIACMTMGYQLMKRLGITNCLFDVAGGTGYIATNGGSSNNYQTRAANVATFMPDIVFVDEAIINDGGGNTAAAIQAAAATTFATMRAASPFMPIVVFGGGVTTTNSRTTLLAGDNAVAAAVAAMQAAGDLNIWFISRINDPVGPWSGGTGRSSAPTGDGNSDFHTSSDGSHRTDVGHGYEGRRMADAVASNVLPFTP